MVGVAIAHGSIDAACTGTGWIGKAPMVKVCNGVAN